MSRTSTLILLGILIILIPFSGLPVAVRTPLAVIFGALVSGIGLMIRTHDARRMQESGESPLTPATTSSTEPEPVPPHGVSPI